MKTYELWARVGVTVAVREDEVEEFLQDQESFVIRQLAFGDAEFDGETYFPEEVEENKKFEDEHGHECLGW